MSLQMNRLLHVFLGAVLVAVACVSLGVSSPARAAPQAPALTQICSSQGLPAGYVVTGSSVDTTACPGFLQYRWSIEPAHNNIGACFGSGYPAPYFITGINTTSGNLQCAGFQGSMTLTLPTSTNLAVCNISVMWEPWVITANAQQPGSCANYGVVIITQASEGLSVCGNSPIPSGWTATNTGSTSVQCTPYPVQVLHRAAAVATATEAASVHYVRSGDSAVPVKTGN